MKLQTRKITDFFENEYVNFASYDNLRKIASLVDGQKNAARKVLWFIQQKNQKQEIKVSQLDSKVAEATEYLHGSMEGVIVNLSQDYIGTNNINLLYPEGNFGTRLVPEASASRYIYTYGTKEFFEMFNKEDTNILEHQNFEGHQIEPKFLLPKLPLLLINGSEGISSGFAQKILPRNPKEIEKYIKYYLTHPEAPVKPFKNKPWFRGFKGEVHPGEEKNQWIIEGAFEVKDTTVTITELPIGYSLKSYKKVLDKLEDEKKIQSYKDYSQEDFHFVVKMDRKTMKTMDKNRLLDYLKLRKKITENYTVMTENNTIEVFYSVSDILWRYITIKKLYLQKRKDYMISELAQGIRELVSKYVFIKSIIDETLVITKRPTEDIINDLEKMDKIIKVQDSFDYLLQMPLNSLTSSKINKLKDTIISHKEKLDNIKKSTIEDLWLSDLEEK